MSKIFTYLLLVLFLPDANASVVFGVPSGTTTSSASIMLVDPYDPTFALLDNLGNSLGNDPDTTVFSQPFNLSQSSIVTTISWDGLGASDLGFMVNIYDLTTGNTKNLKIPNGPLAPGDYVLNIATVPTVTPASMPGGLDHYSINVPPTTLKSGYDYQMSVTALTLGAATSAGSTSSWYWGAAASGLLTCETGGCGQGGYATWWAKGDLNMFVKAPSVAFSLSNNGEIPPPPPTIVTTRFPDGVYNTDYSAKLEFNVSSNDYSVSVTAAKPPVGTTIAAVQYEFPPGLTYDSATQLISGLPTAVGSYLLDVRVTDNVTNSSAATQLLLTIQDAALIFNSPLLPNGVVNTPYNKADAFSATGGYGGISYSIAAADLPAGLNYDAASNLLTGTPTVAGTFTIPVTVTDAAGTTLSASATLNISAPAMPCAGNDAPITGLDSVTGLSIDVNGGFNTLDHLLLTKVTPSTTTLLGGITAPAIGDIVNYTGLVATNGCEVETMILKPGIRISGTSFPNGLLGSAYSAPIPVEWGVSPYQSISISGFPPSISVDTQNQSLYTPIGGSLNQYGQFDINVNAIDALGYAVNSTLKLVIDAPPLTLTNVSVPPAIVGQPYATTLVTATGGSAALASTTEGANQITFTVSSVPPLPAWAKVTGATISGTPTSTGTGKFDLTITATDNAAQPAVTSTATATFSAWAAVKISSVGTLSTGQVNVAYPAKTLSATGGNGMYTFSATGLPAGMSISGNTLSGTPTQSGTFSVIFTATDSDGRTASTAATSITIKPALVVNVPVLLAGTAGTTYGSVTLTASNATSPYTFLAAGLPPGMTLTGSTVGGVPTQPGSFTPVFSVKDAKGLTASSAPITLIVNPPLVINVPPLPNGKVGTPYGPVTLTATGGNGGYTFKASGLPSGLALSTAGVLSGKPTKAGVSNSTFTVTDSRKITNSTTVSITTAK